ncbi:MAG: C39 family peptidase [Sulfuricurvum sp.]
MAQVLIRLFLFVALSLGADEITNFKATPFSALKLKGTVLQGYELSCGAAALATMMNLYGEKISEKDILGKASTTDMLSFAQMANISKDFGFNASGYKIDTAIFESLKVPVIARIDNRENYAHFVVVMNHSGDFVSILDPSFGYYVQSKKEFFQWWNEETYGYILVVMPEKIASLPAIPLNLPNRTLFVR